MTVGKTDPDYAAALEAVRMAPAAISGTDPVSGAPYAAGYAGLAGRTRRRCRNGCCEDARTSEAGRDLHADRRSTNCAAAAQRRRSTDRRARRIHKGGNTLAHGAAARAAKRAASATGSTSSSGGARRWSAASTGSAAAPKRWKRASPRAPTKSSRWKPGWRKRASRCWKARRIRNQAGKCRSVAGALQLGLLRALGARRGAARPRAKRSATTIDLERGGQAASMLVISNYEFNSPGLDPAEQDGSTPSRPNWPRTPA